MEGWLDKRKEAKKTLFSGRWKRRYVRLVHTHLECYQAPEEHQNPAEVIDLKSVIRVGVLPSRDDCEFFIHADCESFCFRAMSPHERNGWLNCLSVFGHSGMEGSQDSFHHMDAKNGGYKAISIPEVMKNA